ncbi:MAG: hypothetical protein Q4E57_07685 [Eubacteriales bacterium]|nr:hypothetical protein [Eubacteriales bacterium]
MKNYLRADLYRIVTRPAFWIVHIIGIIALFITAVLSTTVELNNDIEYLSNASTIISLGIFFIGIYYLFGIFGNDARARTGVMALGRGVSRRDVVTVHFLETFMLVGFTWLMLSITGIIIGKLIFNISGYYARLLISHMISSSLDTVFSLEFSMLLMLLGFGMIPCFIIFLCIQFDVISIVFSLITMLPPLMNFDFDAFLPGGITSKISYYLSYTGSIPIIPLFSVLVYMLAVFVLAIILYKRKELDF